MKSMREIFRSHCVFDANGKHIGGTDKASNHNYGPAYDALFPDRSKVKLMMEIGITDGSSMLAWREIFPEALIVGMDIEWCPLAGERLEVHKGDQREFEACMRAAGNRQFDFILEDAYHSLDNTLLTLFWLWPFVKPGGIYIVEEFYNIGATKANVLALLPNVEIVDTAGPFGGNEPLVAMRKPL